MGYNGELCHQQTSIYGNKTQQEHMSISKTNWSRGILHYDNRFYFLFYQSWPKTYLEESWYNTDSRTWTEPSDYYAILHDI